MSYDGLGAGSLDYAPCRYGHSRLFFRGPQRRLDVPYVACLGGTKTYGKYVKTPYPALVESDLGLNCVNFGVLNAGIDVFLHDEHLIGFAANARVTVLQVVGAQNLSNRFYSVHPRRNDRFISASQVLKTIYPEVDFAEFHFNKHMLSTLYSVSRDRFATVRRELQDAWTARMQLLIKKIGGDVVLVWFADHAPLQDGEIGLDPAKAGDPLFVTREMLEKLRPHARDIVELVASRNAVASGTQGMVFGEMEALAAAEMLGPRAHGELAVKLGTVLRDIV
jgi:hypothetical protein